jgi:hypothetical protein
MPERGPEERLVAEPRVADAVRHGRERGHGRLEEEAEGHRPMDAVEDVRPEAVVDLHRPAVL